MFDLRFAGQFLANLVLLNSKMRHKPFILFDLTSGDEVWSHLVRETLLHNREGPDTRHVQAIRLIFQKPVKIYRHHIFGYKQGIFVILFTKLLRFELCSFHT